MANLWDTVVTSFTKQFMLQRILVYIFGLFVAAVGVGLAINSALGVSPVTSFPYVISLITGIYLGRVVTAVLVVYIVMQIIILRRDYKIINLLQIVFSFIFGYFVDLALFLLRGFRIPTYAGQLLMLCISMILIAAGIVALLETKLVILPAEGLIATIAQKYNGKFHRIKMVMDAILVILGIVLGLIFLGGVFGVREGTVIAAIGTGKIMPYVGKVILPPLNKIGIKADLY